MIDKATAASGSAKQTQIGKLIKKRTKERRKGRKNVVKTDKLNFLKVVMYHVLCINLLLGVLPFAVILGV